MSKKRIAKLKKREARRIEECERFWNEHRYPDIDLIYPEYMTQYCRMRYGLMDLHRLIAQLEYGE